MGVFLLKLLFSLYHFSQKLEKQLTNIDMINTKKAHIEHQYHLLVNKYQETKQKIYQLVPWVVLYILFKRHYQNSDQKGLKRFKMAASQTTKDSIKLNLLKL
ncbi:MAG: hypothetical protein MR210_07960 [Erysipelotrichaceae bacterium]|nr:hypothetical protein [Erysipelotrichaceae bacterium]MDY5252350.1 hypothetical protein [Erysipelotrichaceae bacterium]